MARPIFTVLNEYSSTGQETMYLQQPTSNISTNRKKGTKLTWILALWLGIPEDNEINTVIMDKKCVSSICQWNTYVWLKLIICAAQRTPELTCNHSVDAFIQQRHRRGTETGGQGSRKQRQASHINIDICIRANGPNEWNKRFPLTCVLGLSEVQSASSPAVAPGALVHQTVAQTGTISIRYFW